MTHPLPNHSWVRVTRQSPCPICNKPDWCSISSDGAIVVCMRVSDGAVKETRNGGFLHRLSESPPGFRCRTLTLSANRPGRDDLPELADYYRHQARLSPGLVKSLAGDLGLPAQSLHMLQVGWSPRRSSYSFPMKNACGNTIGIRLRNKQGGKYAVRGSRDGLFLPDGIDFADRLLICEGPTDCAAMLV